jgi:hypothetical protein
MSQRWTYRRFLAVRAIVHEPGADVADWKPIRDLRFAPTTSTAASLTRFGLLFRPREGGFSILYRALPTAANELVPEITDRERFVFGVFGGRSLTGFETGSEAGLPAYHFDNLNAAGAIKIVDEASLAVGQVVAAADRADLRPEKFVIYTSQGESPATYSFTAQPKGGAPLSFEPSSSGGAVTETHVRLVGSGAYERKPGIAGATTATTYVDTELRRVGAIGVVELFWDRHQSAVPDESGLTYRIAFKPAAA